MSENIKLSKILRGALIFAIIVLAALVLWIGFLKSRFFPTIGGPGVLQSEGEKQIMELDRLRAESGWKPFSAEQIQEQKAQLESLRRKNNSAAPSEQEIKKQLEDLNKLRSGQ